MGGEQWVYFFGEGNTSDKALLGGKGCGLGVMTKIGLPVPAGFTVTTRACIYYSKNKKLPPGLKEEVKANVERLLRESGKTFGKMEPGKDLLLLSVRSGAAISMPGMMDTVLNLGLNDETVEQLIKATGNERFALDSYRRYCAMHGDVVMGVPHHKFESAIDKAKKKAGVKFDTDLSTKDLRELIETYKQIIRDHTGTLFPQDPYEQLFQGIEAVFSSWDNPRAMAYRNLNGISHSMGTACNIQAMVFGNTGPTSGTGVAFTRNPATGESEVYGEYLVNAQGEDVVAGLRTPLKISDMTTAGGAWPRIHDELMAVFRKLESHYREMQDVEFTVENGKLYMLQTRKGKRTAAAAVKIAVDMHHEGLMTKEEAILSVDPLAIDQLLHPQLDEAAKKTAHLLGKGLPASPGAGVGQVVFTALAAMKGKQEGRKVILVRLETSPEDIEGMHSAEGVLTARGGMTSHAAVVARGMGKCCVSGCPTLSFPEDDSDGHAIKECVLGDKVIKEGDWLTLDGSSGEIFTGKLPVVPVKIEGDYKTIMDWADEKRELGVRTNADTPADAAKAIEFGAGGIGLVRSEHMFFDKERITVMRQMILAEDESSRKKALDKLIMFQRADYKGLFSVMSGKPVIIRLLDPPLHEFLPSVESDIQDVARLVGSTPASVKETIDRMHESNPMLGFRGVRLSVIKPDITVMQAQAIFQAALECQKEGIDARPEIEVPLVGKLEEYLLVKDIVKTVAKEVGAEGKVKYKVGTMIEVPRAALTADEIAPHVDFFSFGTNDLTQMSCGFSRDDAGTFLGEYTKKGIYERDPFQSIDQDGVGKLMKLCVALGRGVKPGLEIGICGEHGGEPASVEFCHRIGLNDVSCSPFRVPIARLAAAHAAIKYGPRPKSLNVTDVFQRAKL